MRRVMSTVTDSYRRQEGFYQVCLLCACWATTLTASTLLTSCGPRSAKSIGGGDSSSTFVIGVFLFGTAIISLPSSWLFEKLGRKRSFLLACALLVVGSGLGMLALVISSFPTLLSACFFIGLSQGLAQFYRFAALELCEDEKDKPLALSYVLSGGVVAAFAGPQLAIHTEYWLMPNTIYFGSYAMIGIVAVLNALVVMAVQFPPTPSKEAGVTERSLAVILSNRITLIAVASATLANSAMVMLMSPITLAMEANGYTYLMALTVLEFHFLGMFAPGFFTGHFIQSAGPYTVSYVGIFFFLSSTSVLLIGDNVWNFMVGMLLCGVGWNMCFSAASMLLSRSYFPSEALRVQGINDFIIYSISGALSMLSGVIYDEKGWDWAVESSGAVLIIFLLAVAVIYFNDLEPQGSLRPESAVSSNAVMWFSCFDPDPEDPERQTLTETRTEKET